MSQDHQFEIDFSAKPLPPEVQERIAEGMAQCDSNADVRWKRITDAAILAVARRLPEFTVDDVYEELESIPNPFSTHNPAALGPRMREVSKTMKYMTPTDRVQRSKRPIGHGNLHRLWRSEIFKA
jgi:hypothetical protein